MQKLSFKKPLYTSSYAQALLVKNNEIWKRQENRNRLLEKHNSSKEYSQNIE
jgi:hypothetical protein